MIKYFFGLLLAISLCVGNAYAETEQDNPADMLPEVIAAAKISELTGIALNPLLVGGGMRAWDYWQAPEEIREQLHWSAQPWFWGTLLSVGFLFLANNTIGRIFPPTAKAMDAVETLEGKVAPLYTAPLLIPVGIQVVQALESANVLPVGQALASTTGLESALLNPFAADPLTITLGSALALFVMGVIWLSNQAIHALVLICPFGFVSMALRLAQFAVIALLLLATAIHPVLGAIIALFIIFICARIAGWSFRFMVFGTILAWDLCLLRRKQTIQNKVLAFSGSALNIPIRTLGHVEMHNEQLTLAYRPWLILPKRRINLSEQHRQLTHGIFMSQVHAVSSQGTSSQALCTLPPRYRGSENALMQFMGCEYERASKVKSGLNAAMEWLKSMRYSTVNN